MKSISLQLVSAILLLFAPLALAAQEIAVLSFNIRYASFGETHKDWEQRKEGVFSMLKGYDFIGMQEVVPLQMEEIALKTDGEYAYFFRTREKDPSQGEGCPIIYNKARWEALSSGHFWLSDTPGIDGSNTWGAAFNRMVSYGIFRERVSGDSILVINTHFDHVSQSAREKSTDLILERFKKSISLMPAVFMGDLNVTPDNPVYLKIIGESSLIDSYAKKRHPRKANGATFHGWDEQPPVERIDFIFVSPLLRVKSCEVLHDKYNGNYPSDHFPIKAVLKKKP